MFYTLPDLVNRFERSKTSKTALIDGRQKITYSELQRRARRLASLMHRVHTHKGKQVAIFPLQSPDAVVALMMKRMS